jgi:hypothetical protein
VIAQIPPALWIWPSKRPLCVTGMGRCGTSLTTRLIGLLGVDLGPTDRMLPPHEHDNARGYWEQREIYEINEEIMAIFGGTWEWPPDFPPKWERSPALAATRERARRAIADLFGGCEGRWAWKDPRASVTLPFWRDLVGPMDYVLCVRNPADVASSLSRRGDDEIDFDHSMVLWLHYARAALQNTQGSRRLILRYEDYFGDTGRQIKRLADFVCRRGTPLSDELRGRMEDFVEPELWRNRDQGEGIERVRAASPEAAELYARLRGSPTGPKISGVTNVSVRARMSSAAGQSSSLERQQRSQRSAPELVEDGQR